MATFKTTIICATWLLSFIIACTNGAISLLRKKSFSEIDSAWIKTYNQQEVSDYDMQSQVLVVLTAWTDVCIYI